MMLFISHGSWIIYTKGKKPPRTLEPHLSKASADETVCLDGNASGYDTTPRRLFALINSGGILQKFFKDTISNLRSEGIGVPLPV